MNLLNKKIDDVDALIIGFSFLLFFLRLYFSQYMFPDFWSMDYYGYIELGKNIFNKFNFTVPWEIDHPLRFPPFYPILIHLLSCLNKNFIFSIICINSFCASFYIIPLYFLVKKILNIHSAILAAVFTTCYFGIDPSFRLHSDFFFSILFISICWLIFNILTYRSRQAVAYVLAGVLISFAYLTKYSGILICFTSIASILYYFARHEKDMKTAFKMSAFLLSGVVPLIIVYQLILYNNTKDKGFIPSNSAFTFFDGNYTYTANRDMVSRDERVYALDPSGKEFSYLSFLEKNNVLGFCLKQPFFVLNKYIWGLKENVMSISNTVYPFMIKIDMNSGIIFQFTFLFLLIICGLYFRWHFKLMHILFFTIGMLGISFYLVNDRYLMPFMPLYFVLWLFIFNAGYQYILTFFKNNKFMKFLALMFFVFFILCYLIKGIDHDYGEYKYFMSWNNATLNEKWLLAASWIKNDARDLPKRAKVMSLYNYLSFLTDSDFIMLPFTSDWNKIINFAVTKNVNYIVFEGGLYNSARIGEYKFITYIKMLKKFIKRNKGNNRIGLPATPLPIESGFYINSQESKYIKMIHVIKVNGETFYIMKI